MRWRTKEAFIQAFKKKGKLVEKFKCMKDNFFVTANYIGKDVLG